MARSDECRVAVVAYAYECAAVNKKRRASEAALMYEDLELAVMGPSLALVLLGGKTRLATAVDRYCSTLALPFRRPFSFAGNTFTLV